MRELLGAIMAQACTARMNGYVGGPNCNLPQWADWFCLRMTPAAAQQEPLDGHGRAGGVPHTGRLLERPWSERAGWRHVQALGNQRDDLWKMAVSGSASATSRMSYYARWCRRQPSSKRRRQTKSGR